MPILLALNALFGWWWADPLASLVIIYYSSQEALHALRESAEIVEQTSAQEKDR
jgi:Co/Zn/Cd efflux system component